PEAAALGTLKPGQSRKVTLSAVAAGTTDLSADVLVASADLATLLLPAEGLRPLAATKVTTASTAAAKARPVPAVVVPEDHPLVARADKVATPAGKAVRVNVLANDHAPAEVEL